MRNTCIGLLLLFCMLLAYPAAAQQADEKIIRELEMKENDAILRGDTTMLAQLMSSRIVVHNPENTIVGFPEIIDRIKAGKISYANFQRHIERVTIIDNMAAVMGWESLTPQGASKHSGKTVKRRFTNIWLKENNSWKLAARQATIISIE